MALDKVLLCLYEHKQGLAGAEERRVSLCQRVHWKPAASENPNRGAAAMSAGIVAYLSAQLPSWIHL